MGNPMELSDCGTIPEPFRNATGTNLKGEGGRLWPLIAWKKIFFGYIISRGNFMRRIDCRRQKNRLRAFLTQKMEKTDFFR